jgi:hypothetical protein
MFQKKIVKKVKILILYSVTFFENLPIYEVMWINIVEPDRPQITIWHICTAYWVPKATNTHSEHVILIDFPLQQWLHEHAAVLGYAYITHLVNM